jgi:hypothetical protein
MLQATCCQLLPWCKADFANVKCCSCLFYAFSPLLENNKKCTLRYNSNPQNSGDMIYYKVAFETTNCLRPCIERLFA